jgi:Zn-dependent oligopeptidase
MSRIADITKEQVEARRKQSFHKEYQARIPDSQVVGLMMSSYFEWDGYEILRACSAALEDANFHTDNEKLQKMFPKAFETQGINRSL